MHHAARLMPALFATAGLFLLARAFSQDSADTKSHESPRLRRPVALLLVDQGSRLLVANRDSGTIATLDTESRKPIGEIKIGRRLADIAGTPAGDTIAVADEEAREIVLLARRGDALRQTRRIAVGLTPVSVQISSDSRLATVACLWQRRLAIIDLSAEPCAPSFIDLPFAPRRQLMLASGKVIVADSFGGKLAVV